MNRPFAQWLRSLKARLGGKHTPKRSAAVPRPRTRLGMEQLDDRIVPSHFRYGTIDWAPVAGDPSEITFHLTQAWRTSAFFGSTPSVGTVVSTGQIFSFDTTGANGSTTINLTVRSVNTTEDWFVGDMTVTKKYASTGTFTAFMDSSARISTLKNNHDGEFRTETTVRVGGVGSNNPFPGDASPISALPPIVQVPDNQIWTFQLPATDPNGDTLFYRRATNAEAGYSTAAPTAPSVANGEPPGFAINSTGLMSWNVLNSGGQATVAGDLWTAQVMVEDHDASGNVKSKVPVDFVLQITNPQNIAPTVVASPTGPFAPVAGTTLTFDVTATAQAGFNITNLQALSGVPAGMTFSPFGSAANTKTITATWTPTQTQAQSTQPVIVTFQATDNHSPASTGTTTVEIRPQTATFSTTTTISAPDVTYNANGVVTVNVSSANGGTPTGTVTLSVDGGAPLPGTLNASGVATFSLPSPNAGTHSLSASYAAQGFFLASSATGTLHVNPAATAVQIQIADVTYNEDGTANVTVTSAAGVPTGTVTLSVDGGPLLSQALVNGSTVFTISAPNAGTHNLLAVYAAQGNYAGSSANATLGVSQAATTVQISAPAVTYNADGTVTVTVGAVAPGVPTPTGTVTLSVDGTPTSAPLVNGAATFTVPGLGAGNHSLHAAYAQQGNYAGSTADSILQVNPAPTSMSVAAPAVTYNADGTVTVTVGAAPGVPTPTGTVTLSADGGTPTSAPLVNGAATFTVHIPDAGDHTLSAAYPAQGNYASSAAIGTLHVDQAPLTVTVDSVSKVYGPNTVTYSAHATGLLNGDSVAFSFDSEGVEEQAAVGSYDIITAVVPQGTTKLSNYDISVHSGMLVVTPADLYVTATNNSKVYGQTATDTGTVSGVVNNDGITASFASAGDPAAAHAGGYAITATLSDPDGKLGNYTVHSTNATLTVHKADATVAVTPYNVTYDATAHTATYTITGVSGETGATVGTVTLDTTHTGAGTYTDSWSFAGAANYNDIPATAIVDTIAKAPSVTVVTIAGGPFTYTGAAQTPATVAVTGAGGLSLTPTAVYADNVNAGTATASYNFPGDANHTGSSGTATITIDKAASATTTVGAGPFVYTGGTNAGGSGTVAGAGGLSTAATSVTYTGDQVNAGTYYVTAHYAGDDNHLASDGAAVAITITKANATIHVNGYAGVYDGAAHGLTGTATGVGEADLSGLLSLGATRTAAGTYATDWSFAGNENYNPTSGTATIQIDTRAITVTADARTKVYGQADPALTYGITSGSLVAGEALVGSLARAAGENVDTYPIGVGTLTAGANYALTFVGADLTITKANPTIHVNGYSGVYDGAAHGATGTATGVNGETLAGLVLGARFTNVPGGTANWVFTDTTGNYNDASGSVAITITQATPTVSVTGGIFTFDGLAHPATGSVTGVGSADFGTPTFTYSYTDNDGHVITSSAAPVDPGYYTVAASFAGNGNYTAAYNNTATITIAFAVNALTDLDKVLKAGRTIPIKIQLNDANGNNVSSAGIDLTAVRLDRVNADGTTTQVSLMDAGGSNPDNLFRYDASLGGYIFNLSTKGLTVGAYNFYWMADGDPTEHELSFQLT